MEFWDALEDSQYLDAVASIQHGPRPICKWEVPTSEQLDEWEQRVRSQSKQEAEENADKDFVEPLSLDWYVSSPVGFFFFSCFVKDFSQERLQETANSPNTENSSSIPATDSRDDSKEPTRQESNTRERNITSTTAYDDNNEETLLADKFAYTRMNFIEEMLRFQKQIRTAKSKSKQLKYAQSMLKYLEIPEEDPETREIIMPRMTEIREASLKIPKTTSRTKLGLSTQVEVETSFALSRDETYKSNIIGLKGPLLEELVVAIQEWLDNNTRMPVSKGKSMPILPGSKLDDSDRSADEDTLHSTEERGDKHEAVQRYSSPDLALVKKPDSNENDKTLAQSTMLLRRVMTDEAANSRNTSSASRISKMESILLKAQAIIYESLKRDYGNVFLAGSTQYARMRDFLWYQDRRVVYEDFYIMRVLGRGGFGLVSGKSYGICLFLVAASNPKLILVDFCCAS